MSESGCQQVSFIQLQQNGLICVQTQCFCRSQNPIPVFDQSVTKHVGLVASNFWLLFYFVNDDLFSLLKDCIQFIIPGEWGGHHMFSRCEGIGYLVDEAKLWSDVSYTCWCWEVVYFVKILLCWENIVECDLKTCKCNCISTKDKFFWVKCDTVVSK